MTLREYWDYTIKWGGEGYDFYIFAFTGNGWYTYITFGTDVFSIRKKRSKVNRIQNEVVLTRSFIKCGGGN